MNKNDSKLLTLTIGDIDINLNSNNDKVKRQIDLLNSKYNLHYKRGINLDVHDIFLYNENGNDIISILSSINDYLVYIDVEFIIDNNINIKFDNREFNKEYFAIMQMSLPDNIKNGILYTDDSISILKNEIRTLLVITLQNK